MNNCENSIDVTISLEERVLFLFCRHADELKAATQGRVLQLQLQLIVL